MPTKMPTIETLLEENERLKEENALLWDMCEELRNSDISNDRFVERLQHMLKKTQEDAQYHAWIKMLAHVNGGTDEQG